MTMSRQEPLHRCLIWALGYTLIGLGCVEAEGSILHAIALGVVWEALVRHLWPLQPADTDDDGPDLPDP